MANTLTKQVIQETDRYAVVKFQILGDGSGDETYTMFLDISADLASAPSEVTIKKLIYAVCDLNVVLEWDATVNTDLLFVPSGSGTLDFHDFGGIPNNAGSGKTGDILFSTNNLGSGEVATIILELKVTL